MFYPKLVSNHLSHFGSFLPTHMLACSHRTSKSSDMTNSPLHRASRLRNECILLNSNVFSINQSNASPVRELTNRLARLEWRDLDNMELQYENCRLHNVRNLTNYFLIKNLRDLNPCWIIFKMCLFQVPQITGNAPLNCCSAPIIVRMIFFYSGVKQYSGTYAKTLS